MAAILSLLIPTRDREDYAFNVVKSSLAALGNDVEIVVQNNSDVDMLGEKLENMMDGRLVYNYTPGVISFSRNFEIGIGLCSGDYVCVIGDDDGVNPEIEKLAHFLKVNDIEAVSFKNPVSYYWPGMTDMKSKYNGLMQIGDIDCSTSVFDPSVELSKLLRNGGQQYLRFGLPKIYHGIVSRKAIDKVFKNYGNLFHSLSPDIYSTVLLSKVIGKVFTINYPFTIAGSCPKSASAASITKRHEGELQTAPHFRGFSDYDWSDVVPGFYSVETIWAESLIFAYEQIGQSRELDNFNVKKLCEYCYAYHPNFRHLVSTFARERLGPIASTLMKFQAHFNRSGKLVKRLLGRLQLILHIKRYRRIYDVGDMDAAMKHLAESLKKFDLDVSVALRHLEGAVHEQ